MPAVAALLVNLSTRFPYRRVPLFSVGSKENQNLTYAALLPTFDQVFIRLSAPFFKGPSETQVLLDFGRVVKYRLVIN